LSYTRFEYSNLKIEPQAIRPGENVQITVDVTNVGDRAGDEVVQLYVTDVEASVPVPIRHLEGFTRVHLAPGETKTVTFSLAPVQMSVISDDNRRIVEPGEFRVAVGGHQPDVRTRDGESNVLTGSFTVTGEATEIEL
ncbi:MAG: fibronectin type III-like domain-contianing protein, partial [Anaerolineae bacterium]|nr:fibronectin type III-like domain-contianing protein [Anaerolineae bacterium]